MRTYDDAFSGQKIYPGKVRLQFPSSLWEEFVCEGTTASRIRHSHFDISIPPQLSLSILAEPPHMNFAAFLLLLEANL
jgi:hypothetical protein